MSNPWGWVTLRPAFVDNDYSESITLAGSGSILGWALEAELLDPEGAAVAAPAVTISDAPSRVVTVALAGADLAAGDYRLIIARTGAGTRDCVCFGTLEVIDPAAQLGWGRGMDT